MEIQAARPDIFCLSTDLKIKKIGTTHYKEVHLKQQTDQQTTRRTWGFKGKINFQTTHKQHSKELNKPGHFYDDC